MTKYDFIVFFIDLLQIDDEKITEEKISKLYYASYTEGGSDLEKSAFKRVYELIEEIERLLTENYKDACEHYGVDLGDEYTPKLTEYYRNILFGDFAPRVSKEKFTFSSLKKVRNKLNKILFKLRKETLDAQIYEPYRNVHLYSNETDTQVSQDNYKVEHHNDHKPSKTYKSLDEVKVFSDLFFNPDDEIVCIKALWAICPDRPVISLETGRWQQRKGSKGILSAWLRKMENVGIIRTIRPIHCLNPILEQRFPGLKLGVFGRTLADPEASIVNKFPSMQLR